MKNHDSHWETIHSVIGDPTIDPAGTPIPAPEPSPGPGPETDPFESPEDPYPQKPGDSPEPAPLPDEVDHGQHQRQSEQLIERAGFHAESMADQNQTFEKYSFRTVWR